MPVSSKSDNETRSGRADTSGDGCGASIASSFCTREKRAGHGAIQGRRNVKVEQPDVNGIAGSVNMDFKAVVNSTLTETQETSPIPSSSQQETESPLVYADFEFISCSKDKTHRSSQPYNFTTNYGSEDDSDERDANKDCFPFIPRAQRKYSEDLEESLVPRVSAELSIELNPETMIKVFSEQEAALSSPSVQIFPTELLNFEWRPFPDPPVAPNKRREAFSEINCGPTAPFRTPYDAFTAIWSRDIMEYIATETNRYAQEVAEKMIQEGTLRPNSRITERRDTNADELYVYYGLIVAIGMCGKIDLTEYWSKEDLLSTPNLAQVMPLKHFQLLSSCLHFNKNSSDLISRLSRPKAKLYKIAPVIDHLNSKFQSLYRLGRNIVIDESLTQWMGSLDIKQYMYNNGVSAGIKTYEVCEAQTGYLWRFKVHAGREEEAEQEVTPVCGAAATVLELLQGLEQKGRTVWMDKHYTSPLLARVLKLKGFDCVGSLGTKVQGVPKDLVNLKATDMVIGQVNGCTNVLVWRDQNRVAVLSTYHGVAVNSANGRNKPIAIQDYNSYMAGVDKKDQVVSTFSIERKRTHVWYKKLFHRLLNVSVFNSFILHKHSHIPKKYQRGNTRSHHEFRKTLITQLLAKHKWREVDPLSLVTKPCNGKRRKVPNVPIFTKEVLQHFPQEYGLCRRGTNERLRRSCVVCHKRIQYYCPACNVALCLGCSKTFHSK